MGQEMVKKGLRWAKTGQEGAKKGPRWAKMGQEGAKIGPRWAQKGPRCPQESDFGAFLVLK